MESNMEKDSTDRQTDKRREGSGKTGKERTGLND